jgi:hypothetical protein
MAKALSAEAEEAPTLKRGRYFLQCVRARPAWMA